MQLFALNEKKLLIQAGEALKQHDYACLECGELLRLRAGPIRQGHFYHVQPNIACRQHQKSLKHLQVQWRLQQLFPDSQLECPFPSIHRIADCALHDEKIIFEVQCSPISAEEVLKRNSDYASQGYQVVWLLHDNCFNQKRLSAAEHALIPAPHYFTDIDRHGKGTIYDQYAHVHKGVRYEVGQVLPLNLKEMHRTIQLQEPASQVARQRAQTWRLFFGGDLVVKGCKSALHIEQKRKVKKKRGQFFVKLYLSIFRYFLDSVKD